MIQIVVTVIAGAIAGWLLTVPLHRFKERRPMTPRDVAHEDGLDIRAVQGHCACPGCRRLLTAADVVPLRWWVTGCPGCGRRPPTTAVALQVGLPLASAVTAAVFDSWWPVAVYALFGVVVASIAVVDARIWLIPWWMPWVGGAAGAVLIVVASLAVGEPEAIGRAAAGATGAFALFLLMWFVAPSKLGFGDVRLAPVIGLNLGWLSPLLVLQGLLLGSLVGVAIGVVSVARGHGGRFAFGPSLGAGALLAVWLHGPLLG